MRAEELKCQNKEQLQKLGLKAFNKERTHVSKL